MVSTGASLMMLITHKKTLKTHIKKLIKKILASTKWV